MGSDRQPRQGLTVPESRGADRPRRTGSTVQGQLLDLQRAAGNQATTWLVVQRSGWLDAVGKGIGGLVGAASAAVGTLWDELTLGTSGHHPSAPARPARPDHAAGYVVSDATALLRTAPPELDSVPYGGLRLVEGTAVRVVSEARKAGRLYVEVTVDPPVPVARGWTAYSNLRLSAPAPPPRGGGSGSSDLGTELARINDITPAAYVAQEGDAAERQRATELASEAKAADALVRMLAENGQTPQTWFERINPGARFLGVPVTGSKGYAVGGVHDELYQRLAVAETVLAQETGMEPGSLGDHLGVQAIGGLRAVEPATGRGAGVGRHSLGLAIDIRSRSGPNPLLRPTVSYQGGQVASAEASVIERASAFVGLGRAREFRIGDPATRGTGETSLEKRVTQADPGKGFLNLDKRMVMALVKAGLTWGGTLDNEKDVHHFALHDATIPARKGSSTA